MASNFFFKSLDVENFRGLNKIHVDEFRRVNLIGGLNGVGKTSLLEALFASVDWRNPLVFLKPSIWRNITTSLEVSSTYTFSDFQRDKPIKISIATRDGFYIVEFKYEDQPAPQNTPISTSQEIGTNTSALKGITVAVTLNDNTEEIAHLVDMPSGVALSKTKSSTKHLPHFALLSKKTFDHPNDTVIRFTTAIQNRLKSRILKLAKIAVPNLTDLQILQMGDQPQLCGEIAPDVYVPLAFLGDGAATLVGIGLAIMNCNNGAVFLDEFDTAIHYSKLKIVWGEIAKLSREFNCQVFAATHSLECIMASAEGLIEANIKDDLQYIRLDKVDGKTVATKYLASDLSSAFSENWEVR